MRVQPPGLARFASDLPAVEDFVTLGEGDTPLLSLDVLAERLGLSRLSAKLESQNPTGSYKDRVAAMSLSLARERGNRGWIATSSGNAGLSMAAYGTRAGCPGFLCMVASAPAEKRRPLMPYSVHVVAIEGIGRQASGSVGTNLMELVRIASSRHNLFLAITAHAFNPDGMRGVDTISYELVEQAPDTSHVYVPTGGGGLLVAIARGLQHRGAAAKVITCQPSGCAPIVQCVNGLVAAPLVERCDTDISALQLPEPPDGKLAVDAVTSSGGWGTATTDQQILSAQRLLAETEGVFVEPASATTVAALVDDVRHGRLGSWDHPVLVLTGAGWKDLGRFAVDAEQLPVLELADLPGIVADWTSAFPGLATSGDHVSTDGRT